MIKKAQLYFHNNEDWMCLEAFANYKKKWFQLRHFSNNKTQWVPCKKPTKKLFTADEILIGEH